MTIDSNDWVKIYASACKTHAANWKSYAAKYNIDVPDVKNELVVYLNDDKHLCHELIPMAKPILIDNRKELLLL